MEKMRDPPFAEQALNLIKTRGLLNAMSEFEKMKAYSEWLEGLRAEPYLFLAFSFAGVTFRTLVACPSPVRMLQPPLSLPGLGMAVPGASRPSRPFALQTDFSQKRGASLEPPTAPIAKEARCWERAISTAFPKLLTLRGGGRRAPVTGKTRLGAQPHQAARGNGSGRRSDKEREATALLPIR